MTKSILKRLKLIFPTFMRHFKFFYHPSSIAALFVNFWLPAANGGAALGAKNGLLLLLLILLLPQSFTQTCLFC